MKTITFVLLGTCLLYYGTFLWIGSSGLATIVMSDCNSTYNKYLWKDSINIFSGYLFSSSEYTLIASAFRNPKKVVAVKEMASLPEYFNSSEHFNYVVDFQFSRFLPYQMVMEQEKIFEYGASRKKTYL